MKRVFLVWQVECHSSAKRAPFEVNSTLLRIPNAINSQSLAILFVEVSVQLASFSILFKLFLPSLTTHKNLFPRNSFDLSSLLSSSLEPYRCSSLETNVSITTHSSTFTRSRNFSNSFNSASRSPSYLGCSTLLLTKARTTHLRPGRKNVGRHRASKLLFSCDCSTLSLFAEEEKVWVFL